MQFLRTLRDNGTPAWQRLQAARAIEAYQRLVLEDEVPSLRTIRMTLSRLADQEKARPGECGGGVGDDSAAVGVVDPREPPLVQQCRRELRLRHKSLRTERACMEWMLPFMRFCGAVGVERCCEAQIKSFLTSLAVEGNVAASTQNQAKCAILFLFRAVLGRELGFLDIAMAGKSERLLVVLSTRESERLYAEFFDVPKPMFAILYGAGLRHAPARGWCRRPHRAGSARPQGREHDDGLSARDEKAGPRRSQPDRRTHGRGRF